MVRPRVQASAWRKLHLYISLEGKYRHGWPIIVSCAMSMSYEHRNHINTYSIRSDLIDYIILKLNVFLLNWMNVHKIWMTHFRSIIYNNVSITYELVQLNIYIDSDAITSIILAMILLFVSKRNRPRHICQPFKNDRSKTNREFSFWHMKWP